MQVVEAKVAKLVNVRGVVTATTDNCYFVAVFQPTSSKFQAVEEPIDPLSVPHIMSVKRKRSSSQRIPARASAHESGDHVGAIVGNISVEAVDRVDVSSVEAVDRVDVSSELDEVKAVSRQVNRPSHSDWKIHRLIKAEVVLAVLLPFTKRSVPEGSRAGHSGSDHSGSDHRDSSAGSSSAGGSRDIAEGAVAGEGMVDDKRKRRELYSDLHDYSLEVDDKVGLLYGTSFLAAQHVVSGSKQAKKTKKKS